MTNRQKEMFEKGFVTPKVVAERLKIRVESVYRLIKSGKMEYTKVGGSFFIKETSIGIHNKDVKSQPSDNRASEEE